MKKLLLLAMVLMLSWTVYLKNGEQICVKEVNTGAFSFVRMMTCDGKEILIPYNTIIKIEKN